MRNEIKERVIRNVVKHVESGDESVSYHCLTMFESEKRFFMKREAKYFLGNFNSIANNKVFIYIYIYSRCTGHFALSLIMYCVYFKGESFLANSNDLNQF